MTTDTKNKVSYSLLLLICLLPACAGRLVRYGKESAPQGEPYGPDIVDQARLDLRTVKVYDIFKTLAFFDVLWLSDEVRTAYARLNADKRGKSEEAHEAFLRRQLAENEHFISFYVLSYVPIKADNASLADTDAPWSITLLIDGVMHKPALIKVVELAPEYHRIFGYEYAWRFRNIYLVKFAAKTPSGEPLITDTTHRIGLRFSSMRKNAETFWELHSSLGPTGEILADPEEIPLWQQYDDDDDDDDDSDKYDDDECDVCEQVDEVAEETESTTPVVEGSQIAERSTQPLDSESVVQAEPAPEATSERVQEQTGVDDPFDFADDLNEDVDEFTDVQLLPDVQETIDPELAL